MTGPAVPYPPDTRAKGWRFELDMERVIQSDTWDLAAEIPMAQHALLMMWVTAWQQVPCGSMPADPSLIRAKLKVPASLWEPMREVVLRGWTVHEDGRLYHPTITERVLGMLGAKKGERERKAAWRARKEAERKGGQSDGDGRPEPPPTPPEGPDLSHGTTAGQTADSGGKDDTGTGTGTGTVLPTPPPNPEPPPTAHAPAGESPAVPRDNAVTAAARVCIALRRAGMASVNPASPRLTALLEAGATVEEFTAHVEKANASGANPFSYLLGVVEGERKRAAANAPQLHRGPMPKPQAQPLTVPSTEADRTLAAQRAEEARLATPEERAKAEAARLAAIAKLREKGLVKRPVNPNPTHAT